MIFLDANVLIYYLDESSDFYNEVIDKLQKMVDSQDQLVTSHHVIEEVLFVMSRTFNGLELSTVVQRISEIPDIRLVEPSASLEFAVDYANLSTKHGLGVNDALLIQLMLDAGIVKVFSYDKKLLAKAKVLGISSA